MLQRRRRIPWCNSTRARTHIRGLANECLFGFPDVGLSMCAYPTSPPGREWTSALPLPTPSSSARGKVYPTPYFLPQGLGGKGRGGAERPRLPKMPKIRHLRLSSATYLALWFESHRPFRA